MFCSRQAAGAATWRELRCSVDTMGLCAAHAGRPAHRGLHQLLSELAVVGSGLHGDAAARIAGHGGLARHHGVGAESGLHLVELWVARFGQRQRRASLVLAAHLTCCGTPIPTDTGVASAWGPLLGLPAPAALPHCAGISRTPSANGQRRQRGRADGKAPRSRVLARWLASASRQCWGSSGQACSGNLWK